MARAGRLIVVVSVGDFAVCGGDCRSGGWWRRWMIVRMMIIVPMHVTMILVMMAADDDGSEWKSTMILTNHDLDYFAKNTMFYFL